MYTESSLTGNESQSITASREWCSLLTLPQTRLRNNSNKTRSTLGILPPALYPQPVQVQISSPAPLQARTVRAPTPALAQTLTQMVMTLEISAVLHTTKFPPLWACWLLLLRGCCYCRLICVIRTFITSSLVAVAIRQL